MDLYDPTIWPDTYLYAYVKASLKKEIIFEVCGPKQTLSSAINRVWCEKSMHTNM